MRSSSADRRPTAGAVPGDAAAGAGAGAAGRDAGEAPLLGRWGRLVLATLLVGAALIGPAAGYASAKFGNEATVTITITITPTDGAAPSPTDTPTAALDEPAPLP
ncbi:hypothetical protein [Cellulomonas sp.]|uniref:hypothetical protein n=1 Tax=Cellulomonas sp. TaxID=40001 RepID=UPI002D67702C|nr:hypothetical protein [Cellulomonas sp.]HYQ74413.1 hypothetical protein [Cellulomonas sp.]